MTRRARRHAPTTTPALRVLADCFAPVCTLVGKTWGLHLEKVVRVDREENLRDDRRVGRVPRRARASASSTTPSTSSTAGATTATTRCAACARPPRRAPRRVVLCDTNGGVAAGADRRRRRATSRAALAPTARGRHPLPRRRRLRRRQLARRRRGGRDAGAGHDERLRRAHRQREPRRRSSPTCSSKLGHDVPAAEQLATLTETAHFVDELLNRTPEPDQPYVGKNAFAHKGGMHVAGVRADAVDVRAHRPGAGRQPPRAARLRARGQGHRASRAPRRPGLDARRRRRAPRDRARQGARARAATSSRPPTARSSCCCARRRATTSRCSGWSRGA